MSSIEATVNFVEKHQYLRNIKKKKRSKMLSVFKGLFTKCVWQYFTLLDFLSPTEIWEYTLSEKLFISLWDNYLGSQTA